MYGSLKENGDYTSIINERHFNRLRSWTDDASRRELESSS
jgi:coniferyl-aldehyde dehydrogenase